MVQDKQGHSLEFKDFFDEDGQNLYWEYFCPIESKQVIITESKGKKEEDVAYNIQRTVENAGVEVQRINDSSGNVFGFDGMLAEHGVWFDIEYNPETKKVMMIGEIGIMPGRDLPENTDFRGAFEAQGLVVSEIHYHGSGEVDVHFAMETSISGITDVLNKIAVGVSEFPNEFDEPKPVPLEEEVLPQEEGPQGHFYGDAEWYPQGSVEPKYEEATMPQTTASIRPYQLTPAEFDAITKEAWEESCPECLDILQSIEEKDGEHNLYPTYYQADHLQNLFGYSADPSMTPTGYLDPDDPQWQQSVEHIQEYTKEPEKGGTFGPQSGMMRGEPTRDEWQITSYLDQLGVPYVHKMKIGELDPTDPRPKLEYDIYIPDYLMAIETSPGWHEGGPHAANFPQVTENDKYKRNFAKEHGIDLEAFDPANGTEKFINETLVPKLRAVGVDAFEVPEGEEKKKRKEETQNYCDCDEPTLKKVQNFYTCTNCGRPLFGLAKDYDKEHGKREEGQGIYHQKALDWMYSNLKDEGDGVIICKICDWGWVYPTQDELIDHFSEPSHWPDAPQSTADKFFDLFTLGEEKEEEQYTNVDCPYCHEPFIYQEIGKHVSSKHPEFRAKQNEFQRGNPFNQQFIYREDSRYPVEIRKAGYDWDYNVPYRKKPMLEEQSPPVNQNIPTGAYETIEPTTLDQSQNFPRFPERGKVNEITQEGEGEELEATNNLFLEQEGARTAILHVTDAGKQEASDYVTAWHGTPYLEDVLKNGINLGKDYIGDYEGDITFLTTDPEEAQNYAKYGGLTKKPHGATYQGRQGGMVKVKIPKDFLVNTKPGSFEPTEHSRELNQGMLPVEPKTGEKWYIIDKPIPPEYIVESYPSEAFEGSPEDWQTTAEKGLVPIPEWFGEEKQKKEEDRYECNCQVCDCHRPLAEGPRRCGYCASGDHNPEPRKSKEEQEPFDREAMKKRVFDIVDQGTDIITTAVAAGELTQIEGDALLAYATKITELTLANDNTSAIALSNKMLELIQQKMANPISPIST